MARRWVENIDYQSNTVIIAELVIRGRSCTIHFVFILNVKFLNIFDKGKSGKDAPLNINYKLLIINILLIIISKELVDTTICSLNILYDSDLLKSNGKTIKLSP